MNVEVNVNPKRQKPKHPRGLYICGLTVAWSNFAYYGVRSVLVFFLSAQIASGGLGLTKADAASLVGTYAALNYFSPVIGGWICDRYLGARYCIILGGLLRSVGYFIGFLSIGKFQVYLMMALVIIGGGLFKGNLNTIAGSLYEQNDSRKDGAFSILYSFVNIGVMVGPLLCGLLANDLFAIKDGGKIIFYGFKYVFLVGAIGDLMTALTFIAGLKKFGDLGKIPAAKLHPAKNPESHKSTEPLTREEKNRTIAILILAFFSTFFWTAYNQASTSIALYTNDFINMNIGGFDVPVPWLDSFNGFLCVALGPIMSAVWLKLSKSKRGDLNITQKMSLGFIFLSSGFLFMILAVLQRGTSSDTTIKASVAWVLLFYIFQGVGEMCFSPIGNSMVSRLAPAKYASVLMGSWFLSIFAANKLAGYGQGLIEKLGTLQVFLAIPIVLVVSGAILLLLNKRLEKLME